MADFPAPRKPGAWTDRAKVCESPGGLPRSQYEMSDLTTSARACGLVLAWMLTACDRATPASPASPASEPAPSSTMTSPTTPAEPLTPPATSARAPLALADVAAYP